MPDTKTATPQATLTAEEVAHSIRLGCTVCNLLSPCSAHKAIIEMIRAYGDLRERLAREATWKEAIKIPEATPIIINRLGMERGSESNGWECAVVQITEALKSAARKAK